MIIKKYLLFVFLLSLCNLAKAFEVPKLTGPVIDQVQLLSPQAKNHLEQTLFQLQSQQKIQIQVFITSTLNNEAIESVAIQIFDKWKLGDEKKDTGLLFLIAPNEKKLRIEVGQGLEGVVPDITAKRIIADVVTPYFRRGEFDQGIIQGVASLQSYIITGKFSPAEGAEGADQNSPQKKSKEKGSGAWVFLILLGLWLLIFIISPSTALQILFFAMSSGGRGGGGGRDNWSGGGGSSSGGGASGGW